MENSITFAELFTYIQARSGVLEALKEERDKDSLAYANYTGQQEALSRLRAALEDMQNSQKLPPGTPDPRD